MHEEWKPVTGYEGYLEVSSHGRVRTLDTVRPQVRRGMAGSQRRPGTVMSPFKHRAGYLQVAPQIGETRRKLYVHRLVALAFVPGHEDGLTVNHINGDKTDNRPENLEWVTVAQNSRHEWATGLVDLRGDNNPQRKLSSSKVRSIRRLLKAGASPTDIATISGVSGSLIHMIKTGRRWASVV